MVDSIVLDSLYAGTVDLPTRTIIVSIPDGEDVSNLCITHLALSEGAEADLAVGSYISLQTPQNIRVTNGDAYIDWTLRVRFEQALMLSFIANNTYTGVINQEAKTVHVNVPSTVDIRSITPTITVSEGATVTPNSGRVADFSEPVKYVVRHGQQENTYTVTVEYMDLPKALFVSQAASVNDLNREERAACDWMLQHVEKSMYASFADLRNGSVTLSECEVIWWHFHEDGGVDGKAAFENKAPEAVLAVNVLRDYLEAGGALLLTRYATYLPGYLPVSGQAATNQFPNNCWGGNEDNPETTTEAWSFFMNDAQSHPIYADLLTGTDANAVYTCDAGYKLTNSTAQWHIGSDWGGIATLDDFRSLTHATPVGYGGDGAVVVWEFPRTEQSGPVVCIGSGCYDWYSIDEVYNGYHENIDRLTQNAINYLTRE